MDDITLLRAELDVINEQLIDVLKRRFEVTDRVGKYKAKNGLPLRDEAREQEMFAKINKMARKIGLSDSYMERVMMVIVECVYEQHRRNGVKE